MQSFHEREIIVINQW